MIVQRSRTVAAPRDAVWAVVGDPHQLPRWWPRTERVEGVGPDGWTSVMRSERGKAVRLDYRLLADEPPRRRAWAQELAGTPFERLLSEHRTVIALSEAGGGTEVHVLDEQRPRGWARFGGFLLRRAMRRQLDDALAGLAAVVE